MSNISAATLPVKAEYQTTSYYCGAACAEMVLNSIQVMRLTQSGLYKEIRRFRTIDNGKKREKWRSSPDGLNNTLNNHKPAESDQKFGLYATKSQSVISRRLIWVIYHYRVACIALVKSAQHWVVVYGYGWNGDDPDRFASVLSNNILGFYIRDPLQKLPSQGFIDYNTWIGNYELPVTTGHWNHKFIAICDPGKKKTISSKIAKSVVTTKKFILKGAITPPVKLFTKNPVTGKKIVDEDTAATYAMWWLNTRGFYDPKMLNLIIPDLSPGGPVLVRNLDHDDYYYLVPLKAQNQKNYTIMCIAAKDASFQEAIFAMDIKKPFAFSSMTDKKIFNLLKAANKFTNKTNAITIYPVLVWKMCNQSPTPYLPFYLVRAGRRKIYIRLDRAVFSGLTKGVPAS
jgi:hypothetical protein